MSKYIEITNLEFRYPGNVEQTLKNVSLNISKGSIFGLLGPNGAGKSTLLSILSGVFPIQKGSVQIAGLSLRDHLYDIRKKLAVVPQEYAFYPTLTARENLTFFASLIFQNTKKIKERVSFCLDVCQLHDVADKMAKNYSGGQKRRLNLAIGLLGSPELLYLDEPTVGIDAQSRYFILDLIKGFRDSGMTVIYTSHYFEEIEFLCDSVAIIDHGQVVGGVIDRSADDSRKSLEINFAREISRELFASTGFSVNCSEKKLQIDNADLSNCLALLELCQQNAIEVLSIKFGVSSLEKKYLYLTDTALRE